MTELKLTPQAIRKVLDNGGLPKKGIGSAPVLNNRIRVGSVNTVTGMTIRVFIKGKMIQVWANTRHPKEDIEKASSLLREVGYKVKTEGFQCIVELP